MTELAADHVVIGVTGPIACGKSTVLRELESLGATTIDADQVYHSLSRKGQPLFDELVSCFGDQIVGSDGEIDRRALGKIVFSDPGKLRKLDEKTHPAISKSIRRRIEASSTKVVAIDAVKLIESGSFRLCNEAWLVTCDPDQQVSRVMDRNGLSRELASQRMNAHTAVPTDHPAVTRVIDNSGSVAETKLVVRKFWDDFASVHFQAER